MLRGINKTNKMQEEGDCLQKKAKKKHIGIKNQKNFLSVFIANKKKKIPANEKKVEKWSGKGVPIEGFAKIEKQDA